MSGGGAAIRQLDDVDDEIVRVAERQLLDDYDRASKHVDGHVFERVVAGVFREFGYRTRVTGRSNDGGIDIILDGPDDVVIGVQVKRWRSTLKVSLVRELLGALVLSDLTDGVILTASDFQRGAPVSVKNAETRGYNIELVNGAEFFDALALTRGPAPTRPEEVLEFAGGYATLYEDTVD